MLGAEELLAAGDADLLGPVHDLAPAVVPPSGIALGVLVRQRAAERGQHRGTGEVLAGDQLQAATQAVQLVGDDAGDVRVEGSQGVEVRAPVRGAHLRRTPERFAGARDARARAARRMTKGIAVSRCAQSVMSAATSRRRSTSIAPMRSTRGHRTGAVDDRAGGGARARAAVEDHGRVRTELLDRLLRRRRGRPAGAVGAGDGERTGAAEQLAGDVVVGQPDGDRPLGVAQVPGQGRRVLDDEGEAARPERLRQLAWPPAGRPPSDQRASRPRR